MYVIGECINGTTPEVKRAIQGKDAEFFKDLTRRQEQAGASAIDVNVGPAVSDRKAGLLWLAEVVRSATDLPLSIDTAKWDIMKEVIPQISGAGEIIINSTKADMDLLPEYVGLAVENNARLIGLTIDSDGVPSTAEKRVELGAQIIASAMEGGLDMDRLFIDTIILPVNVSPKTPQICLDAITQLRAFCDPPPHFMMGLSNVSQRCSNRSLINSTYLSMAVAQGMDAAIMDPLDTALMNSAITAELMMEKMIYCDSYLEAARH